MTAAALLGAVAVLSPAAATRPGAEHEARALKVGVVLVAGIEDPWERAVYAGLERAVRRLGVSGRALVAGQKEGSLPYFTYFARRGYDLVIASSALQAADLDRAAREFPRVRFLLVDESVAALHARRNVQGTVYKVEEAAFLAGYLAAATERRRPGADVVSSVGGLQAPQVDRFIAGFRAGARTAVPGIRLLNAYASSFLDPARCASVARQQLARGSGVVFQVAGACGLGALAAAGRAGRFGVGVDVDQSALGPHVLTSVLKRLDVVVYTAIATASAGRFRTSVDRVYDLRNGGVALGRISRRVPRALAVEVARVRRRLIAGELPPIPTSLRPVGR